MSVNGNDKNDGAAAPFLTRPCGNRVACGLTGFNAALRARHEDASASAVALVIVLRHNLRAD